MSSDLEQLNEEWIANGLKLFDYQETGISSMQKWFKEGHGGINADEMGLGKTCQAVTTMVRLFFEGQGPFLVLAPLSVCSHWAAEVTRFSCGRLSPIEYVGHESQRAEVRENMDFARNSVFITAYHIFRTEETQSVLDELEKTHSFSIVVVDEAQAIKNLDAQLTRAVSRYKGTANFILLTGTPIQNNLAELYSLLTFVNPDKFGDHGLDRFVRKYKDPAHLDELKTILKEYMLRRTKAEVFTTQMAECQQVLLYNDISKLQKELYKGIISKNASLFKEENKEISLINVLMQLRKCVIHPYMFTGVEPEPFVEGEHLVDASGKLQVLDRLLGYCKERGHRCLLFSQFLGSLDIVEDFLRLRGWAYERLDGTCRAEERQEKVKSFQKALRKGDVDDTPFCFLLTTKAGGVGLNLTAADTVIFLDSDWNPQNDIQAMARCHRIGQTKAVRVIRLVARYTVDQYVVAKARDKLKLTDKILGNQESKIQAADVVEMLKTNFGKLMDSDSRKFRCSDKELEDIIGRSDENGEWMPLDSTSTVNLFMNPDECDKTDVDKNDYATYEGVSYRGEEVNTEEWDELMKESEEKEKSLGKRKRERSSVVDEGSSSPPRKKARKPVDKAELWAKKGYTSLNLPSPPEDWDQDDNMDETALRYVFGDVTKPKKTSRGPALILHCVDNGGSFGSGGLFKAIRALDESIAEMYEKAAEMRDLHLGDAHLVPVAVEGPSTSAQQTLVGLLVAQSHKRRDVMKPEILDKCLSRVSKYAVDNGCVIHTPRMGKYTDISWYTVDRMLKKHFSLRGVPCLVYYHPPAKKEDDDEYEVDEVEETRKDSKTPSPAPKRTPMAELPVPTDEDDDMATMEEEIQLEKITPAKEDGKRPRRTRSLAKSYKEPAEQDEEDDCSSESEASGSDWEEVEDEKDEVESSEDEEEESGDEEIEEEELEEEEETPKKKKIEKKVVKRKDKEEEDVDEDIEDIKRQLKEKRESEEASKENQHKKRSPKKREPENDLLFEDDVYSLYGLDNETLTVIKPRLKNDGAYWVTEEEELPQATHAIVPLELIDDEEKLEEFKRKFDTDCIFLKREWVVNATRLRSTKNIGQFVV